jgi:tripartite-type tricarboxylate transporter receptor subunit TctC
MLRAARRMSRSFKTTVHVLSRVPSVPPVAIENRGAILKSTIPNRRRAVGAIGVGLSSWPSFAWSARSYPHKVVRIVVPFPAGGPADTLVRTFAAHLERRLGQPFIADFKSGAGTTIGSDAVAKSAPDGHTLLATTADPLVSSVALYKRLPYDPRRDLALVAVVGSAPMVFAVHANVTANNLAEFVDFAKAQPGPLTYGSGGVGSLWHIAGETYLNRTNALHAVHVPYRGQAPLVQELVGKQITAAFGPAPAFTPYMAHQRLRILGVTGAQRLAALPHVRTFAEQGVQAEALQLRQWFAFLVPAATPADTIGLLNAEFVRAIDEPDVRAMLDTFGFQPLRVKPGEARSMFDRELAVVPRLIQELGIEPQ